MARIRTIKPEFWDSPDVARASLPARLLYIAMWNWADDHGVGTANLKELEGFAFPNDDVAEILGGSAAKGRNFRDLVAEVSECFGVTFYVVKNRPYYFIPSWEKHQRNEKRATGKHPKPDEADTYPDLAVSENRGSSENFRREDAEAPTSSVPGTGEQGNRGTGEEKTSSPQAAKPAEPSRFVEFWSTYPRKQGRGDALKAYAKALKKVSAHELIEAADRYRNDPNRDQQFTAMAATWLNRESWTDEPLPARSGKANGTDRAREIFAIGESLMSNQGELL